MWFYTFFGGLRATFFASYLHTTIIFTVLIIFGFSVYASSTAGVGSAADVYSSLQISSESFRQNTKALHLGLLNNTGAGRCYDRPLGLLKNQGVCYGAGGPSGGEEGGKCAFEKCDSAGCGEAIDSSMVVMDGSAEWKDTECADGEMCYPSYATMSSGGGLLFGVVNIVGNFGTVFVDQSYWQSAIAAEPTATVRGFLIGGMVWFAVPMFMVSAAIASQRGKHALPPMGCPPTHDGFLTTSGCCCASLRPPPSAWPAARWPSPTRPSGSPPARLATGWSRPSSSPRRWAPAGPSRC